MWLQKGFGLVVGFTENLVIQITSNYSTIVNSQTLWFTTACHLLCLLCLHRLHYNGLPRPPCSRPYWPATVSTNSPHYTTTYKDGSSSVSYASSRATPFDDLW
jgi:hypothetical protein